MYFDTNLEFISFVNIQHVDDHTQLALDVKTTVVFIIVWWL